MGEYAIRKSDTTEIKIGTCEEMYYLRYEDRDKVRPQRGNVDPKKDAHQLRFRLPFPDEDQVQPGEYDLSMRGARLYWGNTDFSDDSTADDPGNVQVTHESGLLLNLPCYHGVKLPDLGANSKVFWNGKSWFFELCQLRPTEEGHVMPIVRCRFCNHKWRYDWSDIWEYIPADLKPRLSQYALHSGGNLMAAC